MRSFVLTVVASAVACSCQSVGSKAASPTATLPEQSAEFFVCMEAVDLSAFKNSQWQDCQEAELNRAEKRLRLIEADRLKNYPENAPALALAFASWRQFRDQYCALTADSGEAPSPEFIKLRCMSLLTLQQASLHEGGI